MRAGKECGLTGPGQILSSTHAVIYWILAVILIKVLLCASAHAPGGFVAAYSLCVRPQLPLTTFPSRVCAHRTIDRLATLRLRQEPFRPTGINQERPALQGQPPSHLAQYSTSHNALGVESEAEEDGEGGQDEASAQWGYVSILRETVNRGCNISLMGRVYGNYKKRKLNIEHIVPRTIIQQAVANSTPADQEAACRDLFNMFLAVPRINRARRDYKFCAGPFSSDPGIKRRPTVIYGKLNSKKRKFSENARDVWWSLGSGLFVNDRLSRFVPRPEDRGLIGRCILHMCDTWGCDADLVIDGGRETAEQWHLEHPADQDELTHVAHVSQFMPHPHSILLAQSPGEVK
jgi:hypothetical protein